MNRKQRRIAQSQNKYRPAIQLHGRSYTIEEASALAIKEYHIGNLQAAADIYRLILTKAPDDADAHNNLGVILQAMKKYDKALASYTKAITLKPDYADAYNNRGITLKNRKQYETALASYDKAIALKPNYAEAYNNRGNALRELKRYDEALASYAKAIEFKPDYFEAYNNRGITLVNKGNMQEAERMFLKTLALKPDSPPALFSLTKIRKYKDAQHADAKHIQALLHKPGIASHDKEYLYFSLGKIYDDCSLYDDAFECYRQANQIRNSMVTYNPDRIVESTNNIIDVFSKDFLAQSCSFASDSRSPLFIVGMPRSGTTLLASILSNHRSIATAGELPVITEFTMYLSQLVEKRIPYPQAAKHLAPAIATRLIQSYESCLRHGIGSDILFVIDKHPFNFRHLGFISMLFPKARIIHCKRHPLDTGLSNYFQRFGLEYHYSFDLRNIGHFHKEYERIMEHWRKALPTRMLEVSYEDMILNTEQTARQALDFIGLAWEERCLAPHTNSYAIDTASNWQVRQPIYKQSIARWQHYEKHLTPLKEILQLA